MVNLSNDPTELAAARERFLRSLVWGLGIDVATAVVLILVSAFNAIEWTPEYWKLLGLTLAKSVLQATVAYFARLLIKPKTS